VVARSAKYPLFAESGRGGLNASGDGGEASARQGLQRVGSTRQHTGHAGRDRDGPARRCRPLRTPAAATGTSDAIRQHAHDTHGAADRVAGLARPPSVTPASLARLEELCRRRPARRGPKARTAQVAAMAGKGCYA